jgi:hypothetical protein
MERSLHVVPTGPFAPQRWPSIASASAELRRPRHLRVVQGSAGTSTRRAPDAGLRASLDRRRL